MIQINRRSLLFGLTALMLFGLSGIGLAQPAEVMNEGFVHEEHENRLMFSNWRGFVLSDNESQALRVSIESIRPTEAVKVRELLASNMTIEEIRAEMIKNEGDVIHRGVLRISDDVYGLDDISMTPTGNMTVVDADVYELRFGSSESNATSIVGHLNATIAQEDGPDVSQGTLDMNSDKYSGKYKVLLETGHPEMRGQGAGHMMPRRG